MPEINFDFKQYIDQRRGKDQAHARTGAAYAYPGDQKVLRTLSSITPVRLVVEAAVRMNKNLLRSQNLGTMVKVTDKQFPRIHEIVVECASRLHIAVPTVYVAPDVGVLNAYTYGTNEDAYIVLNGVLVDHLSEQELHFVIGHECGHIQNNHVVYMTALHYLVTAANVFVRWVVTPATVALQVWSRQAEITCDRAGLICCGEMQPAMSALTRLALGSHRLADDLDLDEYLKQLDQSQEGAGRLMELFQTHPYLPKRVEALRLFADTHYFLKATGKQPADSEGKSLNWCDAQVRDVIAVLVGLPGQKPKKPARDPAPEPQPADDSPPPEAQAPDEALVPRQAPATEAAPREAAPPQQADEAADDQPAADSTDDQPAADSTDDREPSRE